MISEQIENFHKSLILMLANSFNGQKEKLVKLYMHTVTVHWQPINNVNESRKMNLSSVWKVKFIKGVLLTKLLEDCEFQFVYILMFSSQ